MLQGYRKSDIDFFKNYFNLETSRSSRSSGLGDLVRRIAGKRKWLCEDRSVPGLEHKYEHALKSSPG